MEEGAGARGGVEDEHAVDVATFLRWTWAPPLGMWCSWSGTLSVEARPSATPKSRRRIASTERTM